MCMWMCVLIGSIASHIAWRRCHFTVPTRHSWYLVANFLFMFQLNSSANDKSRKYMHCLARCPLNYDLFWRPWTCLVYFSFFPWRVCVDTDLGVNQREVAEGFQASATTRAGSAICTAGGEVASCGNSQLSAWKRTKDRCYIGSHSHTWDMRWHIGFSSAHPRLSGVAVLWQRATEANCVGSSQTEILLGPPFVCFF